MRGSVGIAIGLQAAVAVSCSGPDSSSTGTGSPPSGAPPAAAPGAATEHVPVALEVIECLRTRDVRRIAAVSHSSVRQANAASALSADDWRVQVAVRSNGQTEARTNGITWLVSIGEKAPGLLAVLMLQREDGPLVFLDLREIPRASFESFGTPPPWVEDPSSVPQPPIPGGVTGPR